MLGILGSVPCHLLDVSRPPYARHPQAQARFSHITGQGRSLSPVQQQRETEANSTLSRPQILSELHSALTAVSCTTRWLFSSVIRTTASRLLLAGRCKRKGTLPVLGLH